MIGLDEALAIHQQVVAATGGYMVFGTRADLNPRWPGRI